MKKILALLLSVLCLVPAFVACAPDLADKGAVIPVYLSGQVTTVDPIRAYYDDVNAKVASLLYQCMTTLDENGNVQLAAAESYTVIEDVATGTYGIEFILKENAWNDGRAVSADDFAFAWRRVLEPTTSSDAACLLFDIKNAKAYNNNMLDGSKYDVGIVPDDNKLTVYFEAPINYDQFLLNLSSLALAPLREDGVSQHEEWGSIPTLIYTNGPFAMKKFAYGETMVLERNQYYYRDVDNDEYYEVVKPYQLVIDLSKDADTQLSEFDEGNKLFYVGELSNLNLSLRQGQLVISDTMTVHAYYFNTTKEPFNNPDVRKALSAVIDRSTIEMLVPLTKAATGLVPNGVLDTTAGTSFREVGDAVSSPISKYASMLDAAQLQAIANIPADQKKITLGYRAADETSKAIADLVVQQWATLGFEVTLKAIEAKKDRKNKNDYWYAKDDFYAIAKDLANYSANTDTNKKNDIDVIAVDYRVPTADAFSVLAPFAPSYSGGALNTNAGIRVSACHTTGYRNSNYEALIASAAESRNLANRAAILHDAEEMLLNDMPIIPIVTLQNAYLAAANLSGFYTDYHGVVHFDAVEMSDYIVYSEASSNSQSLSNSDRESNRVSNSESNSASASVEQSASDYNSVSVSNSQSLSAFYNPNPS